jgi:hypothetical protein
MAQARFPALLTAAIVVLSATSVRAQDNVEVLDEKSSDVPEESSESSDSSDDDDGGWSEDDYDDEPSGSSALHFGLRTGWGIPLGESAAGEDFSDGILGQIPIWVDLGWQATPKFMAGLYFSYGFVLLESDTCPDGSDCSAADVRLGLQLQYSFSPRKPADFWLGAGIGYEWASTTIDGNTATARGFEFLMLQLGVDFGGSEESSTVFGPFAAFTVGQFDTVSTSGDRGSDSADIEDTALHHWLFLGFRAVMK